MEYAIELEWTTEFKVLNFFKEWANRTPAWSDHKKPVGTWAVVHPDTFKKIECLTDLNEKFKNHGFIIHDGVLRTVNPRQFTGIHTDSVMASDGTNVPLSLSLNIPIENQSEATTYWYDLSKNSVFANEETREGLISTDSIFRKVVEHQLIDSALECVKFSLRMSKPVLINTGIPHNVDMRYSRVKRTILSLHLRDLTTNKMLGWEDRHRVLEIRF